MQRHLADLLTRMGTPTIFLEIAAGTPHPPLTDYHLKPMPIEGSTPIPQELVDGNELIPVFRDGDMYSIYCVDKDTLEILEIDIEEPWPPANRFGSWQDLAAEIVRVFEENNPEEAPLVKKLLRHIV